MRRLLRVYEFKKWICSNISRNKSSIFYIINILMNIKKAKGKYKKVKLHLIIFFLNKKTFFKLSFNFNVSIKASSIFHIFCYINKNFIFLKTTPRNLLLKPKMHYIPLLFHLRKHLVVQATYTNTQEKQTNYV